MAKKKRKGLQEGRKVQPDLDRKKIHPEAVWARKIIALHPSVGSSVDFPESRPDGGFIIRFNMNVTLPSRARARGETETGVKASEPITLLFPPAYPYEAPLVLLRPDFNTSLPHINPVISTTDRQRYISPCIYDGPINDLLHEEGDGLSEVLNQLVDWLNKAAINDLIDPKQGWEPMRRDYTSGWMAYDISHFQAHVREREGSCVFGCNTWIESGQNDEHHCVWVIDDKPVAAAPWLIANSFNYQNIPFGQLYRCLTVLVWGNSEPVVGRYLPEDVENLHQLYERAKDYGTFDALAGAMANLGWVFKKASFKLVEFPIFVVLCVRRPHSLIGCNSSLEFIPYLIVCRVEERIGPLSTSTSAVLISENSPVAPMGHRHKVTNNLLRRMSGVTEGLNEGAIVHIGCGSVGSKIAMHLAKSGQEPHVLVDRAAFSPHNVARHALVPPVDIAGIPKAMLLAGEIRRLRVEAEPVVEDIIEIGKGRGKNSNLLRKSNRLVIESTGSIAVRDMLASLPEGHLTGRLMHAVLYEQGRVGILAIEGPGRNPNVNDLALRLYDECIDNAELRSLFSDKPSIGRQEVGLGCGSQTMVMPDTRVSLFSSGMAQRAMHILGKKDGMPGKGELWIGKLTKDEMAVSWELFETGPTKILRFSGQSAWEVRLPDRAIHLMRKEMDAWGEMETGGALIGRISLYNRCFNISRLIDAPPDSVRTKNSFILGVAGLRQKVQEAHDRSGGLLTYLGTWHSHPKGGEASPIDRLSLDRLTGLRFGIPAIGLIIAPSGFQVMVNEGRLA